MYIYILPYYVNSTTGLCKNCTGLSASGHIIAAGTYLVRLFTPPLDALYPAIVGMAMTALTEDMLMMHPPLPGCILFCSTIWRAAACPVYSRCSTGNSHQCTGGAVVNIMKEYGIRDSKVDHDCNFHDAKMPTYSKRPMPHVADDKLPLPAHCEPYHWTM